MIPVDFDYERPQSLGEAARLAASAGDDAAILAGGQSLLTHLKQRTKRPRLIIDIGAIAGLDTIEANGDRLRIGAMARQADIVSHPAILQHLPLLAEIAAVAADPMVRRRGTLVGALCEADPGGDWLAGALALDARLLGIGASGDWDVPLSALHGYASRSAWHPGDVAAAVVFQLPARRLWMRYAKVKHPGIGWSIASVAAVLDVAADGRCQAAAIAVSGAVPRPQRLPRLEAELLGRRLADTAHVAGAVGAALAELSFRGDYYASGSYRAARLAVLLRRTLSDCATATQCS
jgi:aerobic carbon-monoxide dehydrogenase medium subunit